MSTETFPIHMMESPEQPAPSDALAALYDGFEAEYLIPLWTEIGDLMPAHPRTKARPHLWRWSSLIRLAERAGELVPVGRGGERRAIALANPSLGGKPFATPTLWAAIQYLMPGEDAPEHRHTQHAFRFVVEGEGVWTVVEGDPVPMCRGDFLPQAGWNWHAHHNASERTRWRGSTGWTFPFQYVTESQFFEFGRDEVSDDGTHHARAVALRAAVGPPGPAPAVGVQARHRLAAAGLPLGRHRPRAAATSSTLEAEGYPATRRARARRGALHQSDHRRRRPADHPHRDAPDGCGSRDRSRCARSGRRSSRCSTAPGG